MKKFAEFLSLIFNPLFLILIIILLGIEKSALTQTQTIILTLVAVFLNGFLPSCIYLYFSKRGIVIDDIVYNKKVLKNRGFLLSRGSIILFFESILIYFLNKPEPLFLILLSLFILIFLLFVVNVYRKISLHASGITYFSLAILFLFGYQFWPVLILIPAVLWSRLYLVRHTKKQLFSGFLLASAIIILIFYYFDLIPNF